MNNQDIIDYVMDTPHNTNPTILKQKLNEQDFENRSDWNQNDSTKPDYVKNRTHYTEMVDKVYEVTIVDTTAITPISDEVAQAFNSNYENITFTLNDGTVLWLKKDHNLGNASDGYSWIAGSLKTIRLGFGIANGSHYLFASEPGVFKGIAQEEVVHKIPEKYLPDSVGGYDFVIDVEEDWVNMTGSTPIITAELVSGNYAKVKEKVDNKIPVDGVVFLKVIPAENEQDVFQLFPYGVQRLTYTEGIRILLHVGDKMYDFDWTIDGIGVL